MANHWSEEEQIHLLNSITSYRRKIHQKDITEAKRQTLELANYLHQHYPSVQGRTVNAISERLPYLDNLLAGVFEEHHYANKDRNLYSTNPRVNNCKKPNLCNARHQYNGAFKEYLQNKTST
jgi:hypothetical protein